MSPRSSEAMRYVAWVAALLVSLYVVFVGGGFFGIYIAELRAASIALAALVLAAWAVAAWRDPRWRVHSALMVPGAFCLTAFAVAVAFSRYPRISAEYLGYFVVAAALYLLLVRMLADPFLRLRFGALAVTLCVVVSVLFVARVVSHWLDWWAVVGRVTVPPLRPDSDGLVWGTPSAVLTLTVLFGAAGVAHIGIGTAARRAVVVALIALVGVAALLTGSRAGWFGLGVAVVVVGLAALLAPAGRAALGSFARSVTRPGRPQAVFVAAGVIALVAFVALGPAVIRRATEGGEDLRAAYVAAALRMFAEAPLVGTGPGTWVVQRIRYTVPPETDYYIPHAHDIYAQTLSELGLLGAMAGIVLVVTLAWLVRGAVRDPDPVRRRWGWLAAFALVYFGAHQVLDFYANMPAVLFGAALPLAWLDATTADRPSMLGRRLPVRVVRPVALGAAAVIVFAIAGLEWSEAQAMTHGRAVAAADAGDWTAADPLARGAANADPGIPPYHLTEGLTAARAGDHARAAEAFQRVVAADDLPEAWLDLAAEQLALGDATSAERSVEEALRLGYQRPAVAMPAGDLALRMGNEALATTAFIAALVNTPSLAGDPWWTSEPARAKLFPSLRITAAEAGGPYAGWQIALETDDYLGARSLAERMDPASAATAAPIIDAWSGDQAAFQAVLAQCAAHPLDVTALTWCARLEGHAGNDAEANRFRSWANTIIGNAYVAGAELRVNRNAQVGRSDAGNEALFYGYYTYRRPTPWDLLVPDLVHLTLE